MAVDTPGMYLKDGEVYKVQISRSSGRPYALKLVGIKGEDSDAWSYDAAKGMVRKLSAYDMMTLEQAKEYGCLHGVCCVCGARLTNEKSIEAGIGPICAKGEQFANPNAAKVYQTDEYRAAAIAREEEQKTADPAPAKRVLDSGTDKFGPLFMLSWDYNDPEFLAIKGKFRAYDWNLLHQKWDGALKVWRCSATPDTTPIVLGLAKEFDFTITGSAQALIERLGASVEEAEVQDTPVPTTFGQLAALVG